MPATRFTNTMNRLGVSIVAGLLTLLFWPLTVDAQSTDIARPTPLSDKQLRGNIAARDDTDYYYTFFGGPGKVTIKLSLQKKEEFAYLKVEALDANRRPLVALEASSSDNVQSNFLQLVQRQQIIIRLKSARSSASSTFALSLDGPISFSPGPLASSSTPPPRPHPVSRENNPPQIRIISPAISRGQGPKADSKITVICEVTDDSGVNEVMIQGRPAQMDASGKFSAVIPLKPGENEIVVKATDVHNNPAEEKFTIKRELLLAADPSGNISEPAMVEGRYFALLISVEKYQDKNIPQLDNPEKDAARLASVLTRSYTFDPANVITLTNPTREKILNTLADLRRKLTAGDVLLIFYAGHGDWKEEKKQGYWLPSDARIDSTAQWISNGDLRDEIKGYKAKHILLISDACFSGGLFKDRSIPKDAPDAIREIYALPSRKAITSGALKTVPDKSVFLEYLIKRLEENNQPFLSAMRLMVSMQEAVINNSPNRQTPLYGTIQESGDEGGDFIFMRKRP